MKIYEFKILDSINSYKTLDHKWREETLKLLNWISRFFIYLQNSYIWSFAKLTINKTHMVTVLYCKRLLKCIAYCSPLVKIMHTTFSKINFLYFSFVPRRKKEGLEYPFIKTSMQQASGLLQLQNVGNRLTGKRQKTSCFLTAINIPLSSSAGSRCWRWSEILIFYVQAPLSSWKM